MVIGLRRPAERGDHHRIGIGTAAEELGRGRVDELEVKRAARAGFGHAPATGYRLVEVQALP